MFLNILEIDLIRKSFISAYLKCYILSGFLLRAIIRKALELEYRIQRRSLLKDDFIRYVQYEIHLLELIEKWRTRVGYTFKKDEIEDPIIHRIQSVFRRASIKWKVSVQCVHNCKRCEDMYCMYYDLDVQMCGCGFLSWVS